MKRISVGKRMLSLTLALSLVISVLPANLMVFAETQELKNKTEDNVDIIESYASTLVSDNSTVDFANNDPKLTWETESGKTDTWRYYNGVMLDAFAMIGGDTNYTFIKNFYDANIASDGTPTNYHEGEVDSVPMALALFDLLRPTVTPVPTEDATPTENTTPTEDTTEPEPTENTTPTEDTTEPEPTENTTPTESTDPEPSESPTTDSYGGVTLSLTDTTDRTDVVVKDNVVTFGEITSTDGVTAPNNPFSGSSVSEFSISFKLNAAQSINGSTWNYTPLIVFLSSDKTKYFNLTLEGSCFYVDSNGDSGIFAPNWTISSGEDYLITCVVSSNNLELYLNDVKITSYTESNFSSAPTNILSLVSSSGTTLHIGGTNTANISHWNSSDYNKRVNRSLAKNSVISGIKTYNTALTSSQVQALYKENIPETTSETYSLESGVETVELNASSSLFNSTLTDDEVTKYKYAIEYVYDQLESQRTYDDEAGGNYLHKQEIDYWNNKVPTGGWETWNIGLDSLYMTSNFLMEYADAVNDGLLQDSLTTDEKATLTSGIYTDVYNRFMWVANNMYDSETGLLNHGYSVVNKTVNGAFWSRGIGWYTVALVDTISMMPESETEKIANLKTALKKVLDGMLKWQDADTGMWTNVVNREETLYATVDKNTNFNILETSGSAMMAYALMKAYIEGYVTDVDYGLAGLRAFNGIVDNKYSNGSISGVYQKSGVGTTDEYYCSELFKSDEAKGTGALIMASTLAEATYAKLEQNSVTSDTEFLELVKDNNTAISVAGSGATSISVERATLNEVVYNSVSDILVGGYEAYTVSYSGEENNNLVNGLNAATITIPLPSGADAEDLFVYKIDTTTGNLTEVTGTIYRSNFVFRTTDNQATYVIGTTTSEWDKLTWKDVNKYMLVEDMVPNRAYIIKQSATNYYAEWDTITKDETTTVTTVPGNYRGITITPDSNVSGVYVISPADEYNTWYIDSSKRIYAKTSDQKTLYMKRSGNDTAFGEGTTDALEWEIVPYGSGITLQTTNREVDYNLFFQSDGTYNHNSPSELSIYVKAQAALDGVTYYTVNAEDGSVTEDIIKKNATVYLKSSDTVEPIVVPWSELSYTWSSDYLPNVAGEYIMTVTYGGVDVGTITVNVVGTTWTSVDTTYYLVDELIAGQEYVFTASTDKVLVDSERVIVWQTNDSGIPVTKQEDNDRKVNITKATYGKDIYNIDSVDIYITWYVDENHGIYTKTEAGDRYYLEYVDGAFSLVKTTTPNTVWELDASTENHVYKLKVSGISNYVCVQLGSGGLYAKKDTNSQTDFNVWARNPVTAVLLDGTLNYDIKVGDSTVTEASIMENALIYAQTTNSNSTDVVDWDDRYVEYSWTTSNGEKALNTDKAGTYTLTVKYDNKEIGSITVNVTEPDWIDITDYFYNRVVTLDKYKKYVITESSLNGNFDETGESASVAALKSDRSSDSIVSTDAAINVTITNEGNNRFRINGVDQTNTWVLDNNGYLFANIDGTKYYLLYHNKNTQYQVRIFTEAQTKHWNDYTIWSIDESGVSDADKTVTLTGKAVENNNIVYLAYSPVGNKNTHMFRCLDAIDNSTQSTTTLTLYSLGNTTFQEVALDGILNHTIVAGDKYVTETIIKKNADILLKTTTETVTDSGVETSSSTATVSWENDLVDYTWTRDGEEVTFDSTVPGTYDMTVTYDKNTVGTITVNVIERVAVDGELSGNDPVDTYVGREPIFTDIEYMVTFSDGTKKIYTVANGLSVSGYNLSQLGEQTAYIYFEGNVIGTVKVNVTEDPYAGLNDATEYPVYPNDGAVRINKFADNSDFLFRKSGVTKVELDVAGITTSKALDVILVVDVSNSMGWSQDWFNTYDPQTATEAQKISYKKDADGNYVLDANGKKIVDLDTDDKLDVAMDAATEFSKILLADNVEEYETGYEKNNTISFVTFAGHDWENIDKTAVDANNELTYDDNIDSVTTVFTHEQSLSNITKDDSHFNKTEFLAKEVDSSDGVKYTLQIGNTGKARVKGTNRGNTNYDYAFSEAMYAINANNEYWQKREDNSGIEITNNRETVVIFMTDGAPSHYNDQRANGGAADYIVGTDMVYPDPSAYDEATDGKAQWTEYISNPNTYAQEMMDLVDSLYVVGFDMTHGGFKNYAWEADELEPVLWNLAGKTSDGESVVEDVQTPHAASELVQFYTDLANTLVHTGTEARVTDIIKSDFTLQMGTSFPYVDEVVNGKETDYSNTSVKYLTDNTSTTVDETQVAIQPCIEVTMYDLITMSESDDLTQIGKRETNEYGSYKKQVLETVTFGAAGTDLTTSTEAYSSEIENGSKNIMTTVTDESGKTTITISAEYFTYTKVYENGKVEDAVETFVWKIGDISENEIALSYYVYLEGARDFATSPDDGVYDTNESAILEYVDINNDHATKVFPIPERSWGTAITTVEYYLVNENGQPVNWKDEVIPFEDRIIVSEENYTQKIRWGDTLTVYGWEHVPSQYTLYSQDASYTVFADDGLDENGNYSVEYDQGYLRIDDLTPIVDGYDDPDNDEISTKRVDTDTDNIGSTRVAFGVYSTKGKLVDWNLGEDRVVVDYGKDLPINVLENNDFINNNSTKITAKVVGLVQYSPNEDYINYTQTNTGGTQLVCYDGVFRLDTETGIVTYQMTHMLEEVEKIFTVVEVIGADGTEYAGVDYYLYQPLFVIPATSVYYETDFLSTDEPIKAADNSVIATITDAFTTVAGANNKEWTTYDDSFEVSENGDTTVINERTENASDNTEDYGPIGDDLTYGYDSTYLDDTLLSDGSSLFVSGQDYEHATDSKPTVSFTFKGTGFDVISRTGKAQGLVRANVYDSVSGKRVARMSVLNQSESTWGELYQIPVISIDDLDYGTYRVEIEVYPEYKNTSNPSLDYGNEFYFDAVRIYDPIDVSETTLLSTKQYDAAERASLTDDTIALKAYADDGEAYEDVKEVRDILIEESASFDITTETPGVIFIEQFDTSDASTSKSHHYNLLDYEAIGPNNEVYLNESQAIVFKLKGLDTSCIASIDIGAKSVDGSAVNLKAVMASSSSVTDTNSVVVEETISSGTSMNYELFSSAGSKKITDVSDSGEAYVFITNEMTDNNSESSESGAKVLSITDIKIAYSSKPATTSVQYLATPMLLSFADVASTLEPDYDVYSAEFSTKESKIFSKATMLVQTSQNVEEIKVTDMMGRSVEIDATYEDQSDGIRIWEVTMTMTKVGNHTYKVTGYGAYGTAGEAAKAKISVTLEGGGWQDAKNIFKTLFNCRILSIKRGSSNKLRWSER